MHYSVHGLGLRHPGCRFCFIRMGHELFNHFLMKNMDIYVAIFVGFIIWYILANKKKQDINVQNEFQDQKIRDEKIDEERVFEIQTSFEKGLKDTDLPDAISGKEIYIYHLMRDWYRELVAANRYNEDIIQKLRGDWIDYMTSLKDLNTCSFLSLELEDEEKRNKYRQEHIAASRKVFAIQDAFARLMGNDAVKKISEAQDISFSEFDEDGSLK